MSFAIINDPTVCHLVFSIVIITSIHRTTNARSNEEIFPYTKPENCKDGEYFSVESFTCEACDSTKNLEPSRDGLNCICNKRSKLIYIQNGNPICKLCTSNEVPTVDGLDCIACPNGDNNRSCRCSPSEMRLERDRNGTLFENLQCIPCPENSHPSPDRTRCLPCHESIFLRNDRCPCPMVSHLRINDYCIFKNGLTDWPDVRNTYLVRFENQRIDCYYFRTELQLAVYLCKNGNKTACQHLANMCTLTLFTNLIPCKVFMDKRSSPVWLYYEDGEAPAILNRRKISQRYSLDAGNNNSKVNIALATFSLNGEFRSISSANLFCDLLTNVRFGVNVEKSCVISAKRLSDMKVEFFEPYLEFVEGGKSLLYALPVLIGNDNKEQTDASNWQLVRKFFLLDSVSGVKALPNSLNIDFKKENHPSVIRYAKSVHILIKVQNKEEKGRIFPPLIIVEYAELQNEQIRRNVEVKIGYKITYVLADNDMYNAIEVATGVLSGLGVAFAAMKAWSHGKRNGNEIPNASMVIWFLIFYCGALGNVFIFVSFCASVHTLVFHKGQAVLHVLLPSEATENSVRIFVIVAFSLKLVEATALIHRLRNIDMFLIDWEQPRSVKSQPKYDSPRTSLKKLYANRFPGEKRNPVKTPSEIISASRNKTPVKSDDFLGPSKSRSRHSTPSKSGCGSNLPEESTGDCYSMGDMADHVNSKEKLPVSIWRTYFIANEWFKFQTMRRANMLVQGIVTLLILEVINIKFWARANPDFTIRDSEPTLQERESFTLKFAVGTLVYASVHCLQWLAVFVFYEQYIKNRIKEFVDLCSVANISVFILWQKQFGFYIHGRSVHGFADTDLVHLTDDLKREEDNLCAHRGLLPGTTEQNFIISVSTTFRAFYDKIMIPVKLEETRFQRQDTTTSKLEKNVQTHEKMKQFLTQFIDHCFKDLDYTVRDKQLIEKLLDIEFTDGIDRSIFYVDNNHSFDRVMFYGNEWTLVTFEITLFNFVVALSHDYTLATIVTVLTSQLLIICRRYNSKNNLADKTLIDERFLL